MKKLAFVFFILLSVAVLSSAHALQSHSMNNETLVAKRIVADGPVKDYIWPCQYEWQVPPFCR